MTKKKRKTTHKKVNTTPRMRKVLVETATAVHYKNLEIPKATNKTPYVPEKQKFIIDNSNTNIEAILYSIQADKTCLLIGETGSGKTSVIRHLANLTNHSFRRVNLNGQTNTDDLLGKWIIKDGSMIWSDGVLVEAMKNGYWLVLDELNSALPEVLFLLQSLLDDDKFIVMPEKNGEIVRPHKDFRLFATMNPAGNYVGVNELNKALLSRFPIVVNYAYIKPVLEEKILKLHAKNTTAEDISRIVKAGGIIRTAYKEGTTSYPFSTRDMIQLVELSTQFDFKTALTFAVLNKNQSESESKFLTDVFSTVGLLDQETKEEVSPE